MSEKKENKKILKDNEVSRGSGMSYAMEYIAEKLAKRLNEIDPEKYKDCGVITCSR